MRRIAGYLAILGLFFASGAHSQAFDDKPFYFQKEGKLSSGVSFSVRIAERTLIPLTGEKPERVGWWGSDGGFPRTAIHDFEVLFNGERFWFPEKWYRDLGEINKVSAADDAGLLVVEIRGGDAAGSYSATFRFRKNEVERTIRGGEFPDSVWERTIYHNSLMDDVE